MDWKKAGRPGTKTKRNKYVQRWTKEERSIIAATEYAGDVMLAIAVIRQWIKDGKPEADYIAIKPWLEIIKESYVIKNKNLFQDSYITDMINKKVINHG